MHTGINRLFSKNLRHQVKFDPSISLFKYCTKVNMAASKTYKTEAPSDPVEKSKFLAARQAFDEYVTKDGMKIGIGSGSTIVHGIHRLAQMYHEDGRNVVCVPTSFQSRQVG
jgi:hypothetical protein